MLASAYHSSLQDQHKLPICYSDQHEPSYYHYKTKGTLLWIKQQALYLAIQHYLRIIMFCQFYPINLPYNRKEKGKRQPSPQPAPTVLYILCCTPTIPKFSSPCCRIFSTPLYQKNVSSESKYFLLHSTREVMHQYIKITLKNRNFSSNTRKPP